MSRRGMQVKALLSMGILVGFGAVSTLAAWSGTATATSTISAATVSLGVGKTASDATTASYTVPIDQTNWYPGMSQAAVVVVKNTSSIAVTYSITGSVTETDGGSLGNALSVVVTAGSVTGTSPTVKCTGDPVLTKAAKNPFPTTTRGTLASGASETLCVQYSLPTTAANALQGNSTKVKLTFKATVGD